VHDLHHAARERGERVTGLGMNFISTFSPRPRNRRSPAHRTRRHDADQMADVDHVGHSLRECDFGSDTLAAGDCGGGLEELTAFHAASRCWYPVLIAGAMPAMAHWKLGK
jgi:hypothetical protein